MKWDGVKCSGMVRSTPQSENKPSEANEAQTNFSKVVLFVLWTAVIYRSRLVGAPQHTEVELSEQWWMASAKLNHIVRECNISLLSCSQNTSLACFRSPKTYVQALTHTHVHTIRIKYYSASWMTATRALWCITLIKTVKFRPCILSLSRCLSLFFLWCSSSISLCLLPI